MFALVTMSLLGLVALAVAMTAAMIARLRVLQRTVEVIGGLPDPNLPPRGTRIGSFRVPLASGPRGELSSDALTTGTAVVGLFTTGCLACEAICEQLEEAPLGVPLIALVEVQASRSAARVERLVRRLGAIAQVAYLDDRLKAAVAFRDESGFPTLVKVHNGLVVAAGHRVAEVS